VLSRDKHLPLRKTAKTLQRELCLIAKPLLAMPRVCRRAEDGNIRKTAVKKMIPCAIIKHMRW
jgi:hypothetical protein